MVDSKKKETKVLLLKKKTTENTGDEVLSSRLKALQDAIDGGTYKIKLDDVVSNFLAKKDNSNDNLLDSDQNNINDQKSAKINLKILKNKE